MINLTVGPVQMDKETRQIGFDQIPYFRTQEFSLIMKKNEHLLCKYFDAPENSKVIFLTASGTASMEGGVINFFSKKDKVLVVNGGTFGYRFVELCKIHDIPYTELRLEYGSQITEEMLQEYDNKGFTGMILQLCETSTGVLYDMSLVGDFCVHNNCFLFVDAVSGFLADSISMKEMHINAAITGSQKALSLPPSMSFTVLDQEAQKRCKENQVKSMYFNYRDYLDNIERGQTPFTPAVGTLLQLNEKLTRIERSGGVEVQIKRTEVLADYFRSQIKDLPFELFIDRSISSNCVTTLMPKRNIIKANKICEIIRDEYGIWVCPNGGDMAERIFRVGHIGDINMDDIDMLVGVFRKLQKRDLL